MNTAKTWLPAFAGMVCLGFGPGIIGIYGFFVEPLAREFDVGVAILNLGPVALLLVPGFVAPLVGRLADRMPIKRLILSGVSLAMLSLLGLSQAPSLALVALGFLSFSLGLTLYGPVVINGLMVKLYRGREARALAIAAMGISVASALLPPLTGILLEYFDWRWTLVYLVAGLTMVLWLVVLLAIPANVSATATVGTERAAGSFYRQPAFWLIGFCVALGLNVSIVLAVCYPPFFSSRGFSVTDAGWFLACAGIAGLFGKTCLAWLGDAARNYAKWLAVAVLLLQAIGMGFLFTAQDALHVVLAITTMGFGAGIFIPMHPYLNSRYFDAAIIGEINGAQMPLFLPFGLVGAPLAGYAYDRTGNYDLVLLGLVITLCIAALLAMRLPAATTATG